MFHDPEDHQLAQAIDNALADHDHETEPDPLEEPETLEVGGRPWGASWEAAEDY